MNKEEFHGWRNTPTTVEVFEKLEELKDSLTESLISGNTLATMADETAMLTARIVGKIDGLNQILGLDYQDDDEGEEE